MTTNELISVIEKGAEVIDEMYDSVSLPWQIHPTEYLHFALSDIGNQGQRGVVNALSNAKRALECQIDSLLLAFGLTQKKKRPNLPAKLAMLQDLGVIAPRILLKLNRHRNELEHEYTCPDHDTVEDFVDIVALFLEATRKYLEDRTCEWIVEISLQEYVRIRIGRDELQIMPPSPDYGAKPYFEIKFGTKEHLNLLKALLRASQTY